MTTIIDSADRTTAAATGRERHHRGSALVIALLLAVGLITATVFQVGGDARLARMQPPVEDGSDLVPGALTPTIEPRTEFVGESGGIDTDFMTLQDLAALEDMIGHEGRTDPGRTGADLDALHSEAAILDGTSFGLDPANLVEATGLAFPVVVHGEWRSLDGIVWWNARGEERAFGWDAGEPSVATPVTDPAGSG